MPVSSAQKSCQKTIKKELSVIIVGWVKHKAQIINHRAKSIEQKA
jgi:hypothetical protein